MTPKEKAEELVNTFKNYVAEKDFFGDNIELNNAKQCALIAVDEIIQLLERTSPNSYSHNFYKQTRNEIENI
jgi:hypothetical protein